MSYADRKNEDTNTATISSTSDETRSGIATTVEMAEPLSSDGKVLYKETDRTGKELESNSGNERPQKIMKIDPTDKEEHQQEVAVKETSNNHSTATDNSNINENDEKPNPLSKNQQKKRKRYEKLLAIKQRRKQQDKEAKIAKAKAEGRDLEAERRKQEENARLGVGRKKREEKWFEKMKGADSSFKVCLDCSFEDKMTSKEIGSLSSQIRYCYSANKRSPNPIYLSVSSLSGKTYENLTRVEGFPASWKAFTCSEKPLEKMHLSTFNKLVYLTSDSDDTLEQLDDSNIYVIGGIVDRNRFKGLTTAKAKELGIPTAKLPIDEHLKMCATKVLTTNHVFELLLKFREFDHDWKKALLTVLPTRKDLQENS